MADSHVVSPDLFEAIDEYADELAAGEAIVDSVVPATSQALVFVESAFAQFFENEVGVEITGFDEKAKQKAARARRSKKRLSREARRLIALFQQFCDSYGDVQSAGYGYQVVILEDFHSVLIVRLIERIGKLAAKNQDKKLEECAANSLARFKDASDGYDWVQHDPEDDNGDPG